MWFKQLQLFRMHAPWTLKGSELDELLGHHKFNECGKYEGRRVGFASILPKYTNALHREVGSHILIRLMRQEKLLPSDVINTEVEKRCERQEEQTGQRPSRKERQFIKEKVFSDLLPQAFVKNSHTDIWIDPETGIIGVAVSGYKRAEEALDILRQSLGSLKLTSLQTKMPVPNVLTNWVVDPASQPDGVTFEDSVEIQRDDDSVIRARSIYPSDDEIERCIDSGYKINKAAIGIDGVAKLTLCDDLSIKKLKFDDALIDQLDKEEDDGDLLVRLDAEFILMADTLRSIVGQVIDWCGGIAETLPDFKAA